ncbi:MAG: hypothetical protein AB7V18_19270 [Pyrinomonadaceae bacterium]
MEEDEVVVVTARLPKDLGDWVNKSFGHGFKQSFVLECFENLRKVIADGELPPPSEYARIAALGAIQSIAQDS